MLPDCPPTAQTAATELPPPLPTTNSGAGPMTAALALADLGLRRGDRVLYAGLRVALEPGQLLRVRGENGAGKTSLLRMVCGLIVPSEGAVLWHGRDIRGLRESYRRQLAHIGHAPGVKDELTAAENLLVAARLAGHAAQPRDAAYALAQAGLAGRDQVAVRLLSQGQRRRVALARLLLSTAAAVWVLDEPFNALDAAATDWLTQVIDRQLERGGIVVLTSHHGIPLDGSERQRVLTL